MTAAPRVLFHVEPLVMHGRPFHYWAWLSRAAALARHLHAGGWEVRIALNTALATRAVAPHDPSRPRDPANGYGLPRGWLAVFEQGELRAPYGVPNIAILDGLHHGRWPAAAVDAHARVLRERLGAFAPDAIVTWTPSAALRAAWPEALILHTENGLFSRAPYPAFQFFDPQGLYEQSVPATEARALCARAPSDDERSFLDGWRRRLAEQHRATTPFAALERGLRERFPRLALLPLQFSGEAGFDLNAPFGHQGEYLMHVLERVPADVGVIVNEHPTAVWLGDRIDEETQGWMRRACPQAVFVPLAAGLHAGQTLVPHVDTVINVSSSIGWQALFWGKELVCPGRGHLAAYAHGSDVGSIGRSPRPVAAPDGALAWMLTHYFVRDARWLLDAEWIRAFFARAVSRWRDGRRGLAFYDPTERLPDLERAVYEMARPGAASTAVSDDLVQNGGFQTADGQSARGWAMVEIGGKSDARLEFGRRDEAPRAPAGEATLPAPVTAASPDRNRARIRRGRGARGPALLVQRIPDARRLAGASVAVSFEARADAGDRLECYLYVQTGVGGAPPRGTPAREFRLTRDWQRFVYTANVPALEAHEALGDGHHTELVLAIPAAAESVSVDVADVRIGPADWQAAAA